MSIERPQPLVMINGVMNQQEQELVEEAYDHNSTHRFAINIPVDHQSLYALPSAEPPSNRFYSNDPNLKNVPPLFDWRLVDAEGNQFSNVFDSNREDILRIANVFFNPRDSGYSWLFERTETIIDQAPWVGGVQFSPKYWDDKRNGALAIAEEYIVGLGRISLLEVPGVSLSEKEVQPRRLAIELGFRAVNNNSYIFLEVPDGEKADVLLPYLEALYQQGLGNYTIGDLSKTGIGVSGVGLYTESMQVVLNEFPDISVSFNKDSIASRHHLKGEYIKRCLDLLDRKV